MANVAVMHPHSVHLATVDQFTACRAAVEICALGEILLAHDLERCCRQNFVQKCRVRYHALRFTSAE